MVDNIADLKTMNSHPGAIILCMLEEVFGWRRRGNKGNLLVTAEEKSVMSILRDGYGLHDISPSGHTGDRAIDQLGQDPSEPT